MDAYTQSNITNIILNVHIKDKDQSQSMKSSLLTYDEVEKCARAVYLVISTYMPYGSPRSNNIRLSCITPTDVIVQMQ